MQPMTPLSYINLVGNGIIRGATIVLPSDTVRNLLPWGLDLAPQSLTPPGTHPVSLFFQEMVRAHMTIPTPLPNMTYHEQIVGVPFVNVTRGYPGSGPLGPFFFMPNLYLDNVLATLGGRLFWGLAKQLATMTVTKNSWAVHDNAGNDLISFDFDIPGTGEYVPVPSVENFRPYCAPEVGIMVQPLVSMLPAGVGMFPICSDFDKKWDDAVIRPLEGTVNINQAIIPGLPTGRFPSEGRCPGIDADVLGAFQVLAHWRMTLPYPCNMSSRWPTSW